ncbi:MAG: hypothetical protein GXO42_01695 [bacterium]|nr:hypothetical protein [bacterium]
MNWRGELAVGIVLLVLGIVFVWKFITEFLTVIKGAIPLFLLVAGGLLIWIALEDKRIEYELKKVEEELKKEESSTGGQQSS